MFRLMGALGRTMAVLEAQLMAEKRSWSTSQGAVLQWAYPASSWHPVWSSRRSRCRSPEALAQGAASRRRC